MAKQPLLSQETQKEIAAIYKAGETTQADLAISYGVSRSTIRRALHENGLATMVREVSTNERSMLNVVKQFGIDTVERLHDVIRKGVQC